MSTKSSPRPPSRRRLSQGRWLVVPIAAVAAVTIAWAMGWLGGGGTTETLSYGQFRLKLVRGEVTAARVGQAAISGELRPARPGAPARRFHASRVGLENDGELPSLLAKHVADGRFEGRGSFPPETVVLPVLLAAILTVAFVFLQRRGGLGSAMAFARSRHREYDGGGASITFDDVAGVDEVVDELREVSAFLRSPDRYKALGGRIPKGVLLVGPPGTGKTLLARAVAGEAGVPFFSLSGSDFVEMFVGVGAARVRSLFAEAESKAPCLVFIDELDAIGKARGSGGPGNHDERDQTLNQLLVAMDGFDSNRGIIVLAATNRPETLDAALVRPGRFDRSVSVDRPDLVGREQILKVHARNVAMGDGVDLRRIAAMTPGFVGADLANLVNEAALLAARRGRPRIERDDFEDGVERVLAGPERRQRVLRRDEQLRIAYHEAGHALVARSLPGTDPVHKVSIVGRGKGMGGFTMTRPEDDRFLHTKSWLVNTIRYLLGGTVAEELALGEISDGATSDLQRATEIARRMVTDFGMSERLGRVWYTPDPGPSAGSGGGAPWSQETSRAIDQEVRRILNEALESTQRIVAARRPALDEIAGLLLERETINAADLQAVLDRHPFAIEGVVASPTTADV